MFSIGKQPYREAIIFVSYIHVVYSYNDVTTHIYMRINYLRLKKKTKKNSSCIG